MSIAVSVIVHPSSCVRRALGVFALCALAGALAIGAGLIGPLRCPVLITTLYAGAAIVSGVAALRARNSHRLDISGSGHIRLTVYPLVAACDMCIPDACAVQLEPGSTLWARCMVLHLRPAAGALTCLVIVTSGDDRWRALSAALRSLAGRHRDDFLI